MPRPSRRTAVMALIALLAVGGAVAALFGVLGLALALTSLLVGGSALLVERRSARAARETRQLLTGLAEVAARQRTIGKRTVALQRDLAKVTRMVARIVPAVTPDRRVELSKTLRELDARVASVSDTTSQQLSTLQSTTGEALDKLSALERTATQATNTLAGLRVGDENARKLLKQTSESVVSLGRSVTTSQWLTRHLHADLLTDLQALHQLLDRYRPTATLPSLAGWALSPSGLLWACDFIRERRPSLVVECGSGTSSLWMALALREVGAGRLVSLEHQEEFVGRTRRLLESHQVAGWADIRHAPLVPVETSRGSTAWYDLATANLPPDRIDLLLVDGPPQSTGPLARYPAVPLLRDRLFPGATILVDDADRADDQEAISAWLEEVEGMRSEPGPGRGIAVLVLD